MYISPAPFKPKNNKHLLFRLKNAGGPASKAVCDLEPQNVAASQDVIIISGSFTGDIGNQERERERDKHFLLCIIPLILAACSAPLD
jgi:hypothetical protein